MKPKILLSNSGSGQRRARRSSTGPWADTDPSVNSNTTDFGSADLTNADDDPIPAPAAFQPNDAAPALAPPALAVKRAGLDAGAMSDHSPLFDIPNELLAARDAEPVPAMAQQRVMDAEAFERSVRRLCAHSEEAAPEEGGVLEDGRGLDRLAPPDKPPPDSAYPDWVWFFRDVAERRKVEDALRASEARFRTLVEEAPDAILLIDFDRSRVVGVNKAAERLFGASRDEILERGPQRFYTPEQPDGRPAAQSYSEYGKRALTGEEVTFERRIRRTSGEERLCRVTFVRLPSNVPLLRASLVDITSQSRAQRELASTAAILAAEHESSPDGVLVVDPTARIISINRRFGEIFDVPAALLASRDDAALLAMVSKKVRDADRFLRRVRDLCAQPDQSARDEMVLKDGRVIDRLTSPFKSAGGEYLGRIWFFRDISEGRKAEELLRSSKARFRTLVEEAPDAILLYDVDQDRLITVNKAAERLFGAPRDEILEHGPRRFFAPQQPDGRPVEESYFEYNGRALAGEEVTFDLRIRRLFGEERMCRANLVRLPSNVHLLRVSLVDVTEQRAAEAYLAEVLSYTVIRQEAERRRIARELHDALGQYLAAMSMKMEICGRSVPEVSPLKTWLDELKSLTATVGDEVNRLAWELRPAVLDDIGLEPAIQRFVEEWVRSSGLRFDLHLSLKRPRLPSDIETALYRVLQEGVTNIVKHANATTVGVILKASADDVVMIIEDDGNGFELESLDRASSPRLGLLGMRERLAMVHGSLEIETRPGEGTTLIIRVALDGAESGLSF